MNRNELLVKVVFFLALLIFCGLFSNAAPSENKQYRVPQVKSTIKADGILNEDVWQKALVLELNYEVDPGENIKLIRVDGVTPTSATIADRSYPLTTHVYAVIREGARRKSSAVLLRDWLLTRAGQAVVERSGYLPVGGLSSG